MYMDVMSGFLLLANPKYLHPCRQCCLCRSTQTTMYMVKETLIKYLNRHAGEYQHPVNNCFDLILAYARMTTN